MKPTAQGWKAVAALTAALVLVSCSPSREQQKLIAAQKMRQMNTQVMGVAAAAAERNLIGKPVCINLPGEGRLYKTEDAALLPDAALWRFLVQQEVATRQDITLVSGERQSRFFVLDDFRNRFRSQKFCFGQWAVIQVQGVVDGKPEVRNGVEYLPFDVTMRLTKIRSQAWLESALIQQNLTGPLENLTDDRIARVMLPLKIQQLPPAGDKTLDP